MATFRSGDATNLWTQSTWPAAPPTGDTTTWVYDEATGLLTAKTDATSESVTYDYTTAGRMSDRYWARLDTQSNPLKTSYAYSSLTGERTAVDYADATPDITYTFDRLGRLDVVTDATGSRDFDYAADLQLKSETIASFYGTDKRITRTYESGTPGTNVVGRYTGLGVGIALDTDGDYGVTYGFDSYGRLNYVADQNDTFTYGYLANSNLLVTLTSPVHSTAYVYEPNRNVKTIVDNVVSSVSVSKYTYSYDDLRRRTSRIQEGSEFAQSSFDAFEYNDRSEVIDSKRYLGTDVSDLTSPVVSDAFAYAFDPIGNRTQSSGGILPATTYTTNELNEYTAISGVSAAPDHDEDGNLTEQGDWVYKWNAENRLIEAYSFAEDKKLEFIYDYLGRRVEKKVTQISTTTVTDEEQFLYDGWNRIATFDASNLPTFTLAKRYLWGLDLSGSMQGAGGVGGLLKEGDLYPTYDANGNVMQKLDGTGATVMNVVYDPFGNIISGILVGEYGFSTKPLIDSLDWYYYGFRYYDPVTGRWPNRDPIGEYGHELLTAPKLSYQRQALIGKIANALANASTSRMRLSSSRYESPEEFVAAIRAVATNELKSFMMLNKLRFLDALSFYRGSIGKARNGISLSDRAGLELYQFMRNQPLAGIEFLGLDIMETSRGANLPFPLSLGTHYNVYIETDRTNESGDQLNYIISGRDTGLLILPDNGSFDEYVAIDSDENLNQTIEASLAEGSLVMDYMELLQRDYDYSYPTNDCGNVIDWAEMFLNHVRRQ